MTILLDALKGCLRRYWIDEFGGQTIHDLHEGAWKSPPAVFSSLLLSTYPLVSSFVYPLEREEIKIVFLIEPTALEEL